MKAVIKCITIAERCKPRNIQRKYVGASVEKDRIINFLDNFQYKRWAHIR